MRDQEFLDAEWDYCPVPDACRYAVFSEIYDDYLDGRLEKRRSPGSSTPEWAYRTFTGDHDIACLSGNPFITDLGIPLSELNWGASCGYDWTANDHIREVVDVWKHGWDDDLGTVPPGSRATSLADRAALDAVADLLDRLDGTVVVTADHGEAFGEDGIREHHVETHTPALTEVPWLVVE